MGVRLLMEPAPAEVGVRIKKARESAGLSQRALSEESGLSVNQISRYENGKDKGLISLRNLARIAIALNVSLDELYFGKREFRFIYTAKSEGELIAGCLYILYKSNIVCSFDGKCQLGVMAKRDPFLIGLIRTGGKTKMLQPLSEAQREIIEYADSHGNKAAAERFGATVNQIDHLKARRRKLKMRAARDAGFVEVAGPGGKEAVSVSMGKAVFSMTVADFRKAFLGD